VKACGGENNAERKRSVVLVRLGGAKHGLRKAAKGGHAVVTAGSVESLVIIFFGRRQSACVKRSKNMRSVCKKQSAWMSADARMG
jgi:hypothetical protein